MKDYKINLKLIFAYFYGQLLMFIVMLVFFILKEIEWVDFDLYFLVFFVLVFFIFSLPNIYYFINHYKTFKGSSLKYEQSSQSFSFACLEQIIVFRKDEVLGINQYFTTSTKLPGYGIYVWELLMEKRNIKIASILISKNDFLEIFDGKTIIEKPNGSLII